MERLVSPPFLTEPDIHFDIDILLITDGLVDQFTPVIHLGLYSPTATHQFMITYCKTSHHLIAGIIHLEGQRGDINRYCHVSIVGIDGRRLFDVSKLSGHRGGLTSRGEKE